MEITNNSEKISFQKSLDSSYKSAVHLISKLEECKVFILISQKAVIEKLKQSIEKVPEAAYELGLLYDEERNFELAIKYYTLITKAEILSDIKGRAYNNLGIIYYNDYLKEYKNSDASNIKAGETLKKATDCFKRGHNFNNSDATDNYNFITGENLTARKSNPDSNKLTQFSYESSAAFKKILADIEKLQIFKAQALMLEENIRKILNDLVARKEYECVSQISLCCKQQGLVDLVKEYDAVISNANLVKETQGKSFNHLILTPSDIFSEIEEKSEFSDPSAEYDLNDTAVQLKHLEMSSAKENNQQRKVTFAEPEELDNFLPQNNSNGTSSTQMVSATNNFAISHPAHTAEDKPNLEITNKMNWNPFNLFLSDVKKDKEKKPEAPDINDSCHFPTLNRNGRKT